MTGVVLQSLQSDHALGFELLSEVVYISNCGLAVDFEDLLLRHLIYEYILQSLCATSLFDNCT